MCYYIFIKFLYEIGIFSYKTLYAEKGGKKYYFEASLNTIWTFKREHVVDLEAIADKQFMIYLTTDIIQVWLFTYENDKWLLNNKPYPDDYIMLSNIELFK